MNTSEIIKIIHEIEQSVPVDQWTIEGVHVWPLVRIQLGRDLFVAGKLGRSRSTETPAIWTRGEFLKRYLMCLVANWKDRRKGTVGSGKAQAVFLSDGVSFTVLGGKYYERFCDPIRSHLESLGLQSLMLTPLDRFYIPRFSSSQFIQPELDWIQIKQKISRRNRANNEHLPGFDLASERLGRLAPAVVLSLPSIRRHFSLVSAFSLYFENLLARVCPRICFLVSYYWLVGYGLLLACKRKGVPSVDIQHGLQGAMHLAYGGWSKVPSHGYELLPTYFWCWSQDEANVVQKWSAATKGAHQPVVGGNLFLNLWKSNGLSAGRQCDDLVLEKVIALGADRQVLVTLQPGFLTEELVHALVSAMKNTVGSLQWWLRLHPVMLHEREKVKGIFGHLPNVDIDMATDIPLYALLRYMTVHVTHSSSTVLEAHEFGIKSVVCSRYGIEHFPDQQKEGVVIYAEPTEDLLPAIHKQRRLRGPVEQVMTQGSEQVKASEIALRQLLLDINQWKAFSA